MAVRAFLLQVSLVQVLVQRVIVELGVISLFVYSQACSSRGSSGDSTGVGVMSRLTTDVAARISTSRHEPFAQPQAAAKSCKPQAVA
jgi:hypothetical protein